MAKKILLGIALTSSLIASDIDLSPNRDSVWQANYGDRPAHWLTAKESIARESYLQTNRAPLTRAVPSKPRSIAEFEPVDAVVIAYANSFGFQMNLIEELTKTTKVIITATSANVATVKSQLSKTSAIMDSIAILPVKGVDSYWTRDYGPWCIAEGDQKISIVDFQYNRPRPNDDTLPTFLANTLGMSSYYMDLQQCGGNYMSNGLGEAVSTELVTEENPAKTEAQVRAVMKTYLGINNYHITIDPLGDYIKHVDCWGKYLAPDKILIGSVSGSNKVAYDKVADYFASQISPYGTPYKVYRVFTSGEPYTNSTIVNNRVFVPIQGTANDAKALAVYKEAMPGYDIVGITNTGPNPWMSTDALHCRTKGIAKRNMLYIEHTPLFDTVDVTADGIEVKCKITAFSKKGVDLDSTLLWYRTSKTAPYQSVAVEKVDSFYVATIPFIHTVGGRAVSYRDVSYYITAKDSAGVKNSFPLMGEKDPVTFVAKDQVVSINTANLSVQHYSCAILSNSLSISAPQAGRFELYSLSGQRLMSSDLPSEGVFAVSYDKIASSVVISRFSAGSTVVTQKLNLAQ